MRRAQKVLVEEWMELDEGEGRINDQVLHLHERIKLLERRNGKIRQEKVEIQQSSEFDGTNIYALREELKEANEKGEDPCRQENERMISDYKTELIQLQQDVNTILDDQGEMTVSFVHPKNEERKQQQVFSGLDYSAVNEESNTVPFRLKVRSDSPFKEILPDK